MIVTRYLGPHLRDLIENSRLKVSKISELNDPFEFRYRHVGEFGRTTAKRLIKKRMKSPEFWNAAQQSHQLIGKTKRQVKRLFKDERKAIVSKVAQDMPKSFDEAIDQVSQHADHTTRIICFSRASQKPLEEILLWSHYTANHTGIRIWIDLSNESKPLTKTFDVKYSENLPAVENRKMIDLDYYELVIREAMSVKAKCWAYEDELRSFIPKPFFVTQESDGKVLEFVRVNLESICGIDFGVRHNQTERDKLTAEINAKLGKRIKFTQAICGRDRYELEYKEI